MFAIVDQNRTVSFSPFDSLIVYSLLQGNSFVSELLQRVFFAYYLLLDCRFTFVRYLPKFRTVVVSANHVLDWVAKSFTQVNFRSFQQLERREKEGGHDMFHRVVSPESTTTVSSVVYW